MTKLCAIHIYPVKGLSAEDHAQVSCREGNGLEKDRRFALMYSPQKPNREAIAWREKSHFLEQNDWPGLAAYRTRLDWNSGAFTVQHAGQTVLEASWHDEAGMQKIDAFFSALLPTLTPMKVAQPDQKPPVWWVGSSSSRYPDQIKQGVSFLSRASLRDLEQKLGHKVEMERFRGNLILDGLDAWEEETWLGRQVRIGEVVLEITKPIGRCNNINVNPFLGTVDQTLLTELAKVRRKANFGILATVVKGGEIGVDTPLELRS